MRSNVNLDLIFEHIGTYGRWQITQAVFCVFCMIPVSYISITIVFVGYEPSYRCKLPLANESFNNFTQLNSSIVADGECRLKNLTNNETSSCIHGYEYSVNPETSIVSQWNLVCERGYLAQMTQLAITIGQTVGGFGWSVLADLYGRKPLYIASFLSSVVAQIVIIFSPDVLFYTIFRFLTGFTMEGFSNISYVAAVELFPGDLAIKVCMAFCVTWALGISILPLAAWPLSAYSWRYFHVFVLLMGGYILYQVFIMDESVRWLLSVEKKDKALAILKKACQFNKRSFDDLSVYLDEEHVELSNLSPEHPDPVTDTNERYISLYEPSSKDSFDDSPNLHEKLRLKTVLDISDDNNTTASDHGNDVVIKSKLSPRVPNSDRENEGMWVIVRNPRLRRVVLVMLFIWATNALTYYGLILMSNSFAGNRFLNFTLGGLVEIPGCLIIYFAVRWLGCRKGSVIMHGVCALLLLIAVVLAVIPKETIPPAFQTVFSIAAKMFITATYIDIYMWAPQIFPTPIRALGVGLCNLASRGGYILASFASYFAKQVPWGPPAVFAFMCIVSSVLSLIPPETHGKPLPQSMDDFDLLYENDNKQKSVIK